MGDYVHPDVGRTNVIVFFPPRFFSVRNIVSTSMRAKLATYALTLLLHMSYMTADLTLLHRDLGITEAR